MILTILILIFDEVNENSIGEDWDNEWENSGKFEGDIVLQAGETSVRNIMSDNESLWPNGTIPYLIRDRDYTLSQIAAILEVFKAYGDRTCIKFRPKNKDDQQWIKIASDVHGCFTSVGRGTTREHVVNLYNPTCFSRGTIIHELMHVLGFYHQQSAMNRDKYLDILWHNIKPDMFNNFQKYNSSETTTMSFGYDYASVMHYGMKAFAKRTGLVTIMPLKRNVQIGQRNDFSAMDILKINARYSGECYKKPRYL